MKPLLDNSRAHNHVLMIALALILASLALYWPVQHFEFLIWDDYAYIVDNPRVRSGLSAENVRWALTTTYESYWHPLTWISHMVDAELYGLNPQGHHFNALLLHTVNTLLLFLVLKGMTGALWRSVFAAALFCMHPLRIESVAWVAERKDVLGTFFWLTTLWAYLAYVRRPVIGRYLLTLLSFALGLAAKPTLVPLPFVLILLDYWPLGRFLRYPWSPSPPSGFPLSSKTAPSLARLLLEKLPFLILSEASSLITFAAAKAVGAVASTEAVPIMMRVSHALVSCVKYLAKTIWPADLTFFYPYPTAMHPLWKVACSFLVLGGITGLALRYTKRLPYLAVGWLWFLVTLVPVIGLVQVGAQAMADRFTYVPHIGLFMAVSWLASDLFSPGRRGRILLPIIAITVLCLLALSTRVQLPYWKDGTALFSRALSVTSGNYVAHYHLGNEWTRQGKTEDAVTQFYEALRIKPDHFPSHYSLGVALASLGRLNEAVEHYKIALKGIPEDGRIFASLGDAFFMQGKFEEAIASYKEALRAGPVDGKVENNLGVVLLRSGKPGEAIRHLSEALRLRPDDRKALHNLNLAREALKKAEGDDSPR